MFESKEKSTYFKEIEIIEWIYLEDKWILIQRDWSNYFDVELYCWNKKVIINKNDNDKVKEFLDILLSKLNDKYKSLHKYFNIEKKSNFLNDRTYNFKENKERLNKFIQDFYNFFIRDNFKKESEIEEFNKELIKECWCNNLDNFNNKNQNLEKLNILEYDFNLKKVFNVKNFFSDFESLLDRSNDFENFRNKKIYLWVKEKIWEKYKQLNSLQDKTAQLPEKHKFYVKVNISDLKNMSIGSEEIKLSGTWKYNDVFIMERWNYIYYKKK